MIRICSGGIRAVWNKFIDTDVCISRASCLLLLVRLSSACVELSPCLGGVCVANILVLFDMILYRSTLLQKTFKLLWPARPDINLLVGGDVNEFWVVLK